MRKKILLTVFILGLMLTVGYTQAKPIFKDVTSTVDGYPTWDSDMINIEACAQTGAGIYIAVLDTGLAPNWRDYFPEERIATKLGIGFYEELKWDPQLGDFDYTNGKIHKTTFIGSRGTCHGTHVTSTILGYFYRANYDALSGFVLPPIIVRGIAPDVTIIPVKVLADYQSPIEGLVTFGTSKMVAAGIDYVTDLAIADPDNRYIVSMSLGGPELEPVEQAALDRAIANDVIVVAAAGNEGAEGMGYPGAYAPVISVGASGWFYEWTHPVDYSFYRMWWLQSDLLPYWDITETGSELECYIPDWSSIELPGQELDVVAPGSWVRGPYPGYPGYSHLPWWSNGIGDIAGWNPGNFYYVGGTSMACPHVSSVAAMMLEKNPSLSQAAIEGILKGTALYIPYYTPMYQGSGLIQADLAVGAVP